MDKELISQVLRVIGIRVLVKLAKNDSDGFILQRTNKALLGTKFPVIKITILRIIVSIVSPDFISSRSRCLHFVGNDGIGLVVQSKSIGYLLV